MQPRRALPCQILVLLCLAIAQSLLVDATDTAESLRQQLADEQAQESRHIQEQQAAWVALDANRTAEQRSREAAELELGAARAHLQEVENARRQADQDVEDLRQRIASARRELPELQQELAVAQHNISTLQHELADHSDASVAARALLSLAEAPVVAAAEAPVSLLDEQQAQGHYNVTFGNRHPVVGEMGSTMVKFLHGHMYQDVVALVIFSVGFFSIIDAPLFTQVVSVGAAAIFVGMLANNEASQTWEDGVTDIETVVVGVEAGVILLLAAYHGFDGFQLLLGSCFALGFVHVAACRASTNAWMPPVTFWWYPLSALLGASAVQVAKIGALEHCVFAVIGPIVGGLMVASSLVYLVFKLAAGSAGPSPCWIEFADALLNGGGAAEPFGGNLELAIMRYVGLAIWFLVALCGLSRFFVGTPRLPIIDGYTTRGPAETDLLLPTSRRAVPPPPRAASAPAAPALPLFAQKAPAMPSLRLPTIPAPAGRAPSAPAAPPPFKFKGGSR